jgi:hypothetical protein
MILVDNYLIDASLSERHTRNSEVTSLPVESGSPITDHIRPLPIEVVVEGIVSNTPIGSVALARAAEVAADGQELEALPADEALARFERIYERGEAVTLQSNLKLYQNMAMVELEITVDKTTGNALMFTAMLRQITIRTNERTTIRTQPTGQRKAKRGIKPATIIPTGVTVVFTLQYAPIGSSGTYRSVPPWLEGDPGTPVLKTTGPKGSFAHFKAGPSQIADGYVKDGKYKPFGREVVMPALGGSLQQDETGRVWHSYPVDDNPFFDDETASGSETNAQFVHRVYGQSVPGL